MKQIAILLTILVSGCAGMGQQFDMKQEVLRRAPFDLDCAPEEIAVTELSQNVHGATGCGKKASYAVICRGGTSCDVLLNSEVTPANTTVK